MDHKHQIARARRTLTVKMLAALQIVLIGMDLVMFGQGLLQWPFNVVLAVQVVLIAATIWYGVRLVAR